MAILLRCPSCQKNTIPADTIKRAREIQEEEVKVIAPGEPLICMVCAAVRDGVITGKRIEMVEMTYIPPDPPIHIAPRVLDIVLGPDDEILSCRWFDGLTTPGYEGPASSQLPEGRYRFQIAPPKRP